MKVLAIDTSTVAASAALILDGDLCCEYFLNDGKKHSEKIIDIIDIVIKSCGLKAKDIDVFSCSTGPGSFTGLRVGASAIKGIAQALGKPIAGIPTLEGLAYNLWGFKGLICPILDAQREMVYSTLFRFEGDTLLKIKDFSAIGIDDLIYRLNSYDDDIAFLGDGVFLYESRIKNSLERAFFADAGNMLPRASSVASLAITKYNEGHLIKYNDLRLDYIRKSQAEVEYEKNYAVTIVNMEAEEIGEVLEIEKLSFNNPWSYESFDFEINKNNLSRYIVAKIDGKITGYAGIWFILDEVHITNIAVHPDYRNRGIGDKLIKKIISIAGESSLKGITLEVRNSNSQAIYLYEKNGFKSEGLRKKYYADTGEDAIIMWRKM